MTIAGQERRAERAVARSSGLTNPAEVRRPSAENNAPSMTSIAGFPPRRRRKSLKGISLSALSLLAGPKILRADHDKNN